MKKKLMKRTDEMLRKVGAWLAVKYRKVKVLGTYIIFSVAFPAMTVYASESGDGTEDWNTAMNYVLTWVPRIGSVMLFGGAIEYMIAYQSDDSRMKTQATRFMISGGMVLGVCQALGDLLLI